MSNERTDKALEESGTISRGNGNTENGDRPRFSSSLSVKRAILTCVMAGLLGLCPPLAQAALVDHYALDGNGADSAGGDADGAVGANITTFPAGPVGQAASFTLSAVPPANLIVVPQANAFNPGSGDFSYSFWVKRDQNDTGESDGVFDALNGTGRGYQSQFIAGNQHSLRLDTSTDNQVLTSTGTITDTTAFHHVAVTVDRTTNNEVRFYFDGALDSTVAITSVTGSVAPNQSLRIGGFNNNAARGLDGDLDDLRFYNVVLGAHAVADLADGQVRRYEFESDGTDSISTANGSVGGNVTFGPGKIGQAAIFGTSASGSANRIDVANAFAPGTGDFSFAFWVQRANNDSDAADGVFDALAGTSNGYQSVFNVNDKWIARLDVDGSGNVVAISDTAITDTEFHHYAATIDRGASQLRLYIDGVEDSSSPWDLSALSTLPIVPTQALQIGGINANANFGLDGRLDDLRFYNRALSRAEVAALAADSAAIPEPSTLTMAVVSVIGLSGWRARKKRRSTI